MRMRVTGGAGFIGSNVVDRFLAQGHDVAVLDNFSTGRREKLNPGARLFEDDLMDAVAVDAAVGAFRPELVDHHAAQIDVRKSVTDPVFDARTNLLGGIGLLEACVKHDVKKVVYASTGGALYGEGKTLPATEEHPIHPESPYGVSKYAFEHYLYYYAKLYGLDTTVLRYPNVYGPRQNPHGEAGVNAIFIGLMLAGRRPKIFGDRTPVRHHLYLHDVVAANLLALAPATREVLQLRTRVRTS